VCFFFVLLELTGAGEALVTLRADPRVERTGAMKCNLLVFSEVLE
jgi:hypothetical protein